MAAITEDEIQANTQSRHSSLGDVEQTSSDSPPEPSQTQRSKLENTVITTSLLAALFLAALDVTIVATAIPTISEDLQSSSGYVWIGASYVLANAACAPTWGTLSDIWGRKSILLATLIIFWVGSLLCGAAVNMTMLIVGRAVQGIGGGGVNTLVNICIGDLFSVRERGFYYGLVGAVWGVSSALGPVIGGVFAYRASWRWCFYINLPISGVGIIVLCFVLKLHNPRTPMVDGLKALDWLGSLTVVGGTVLLLLGLELGGVIFPWKSPTTICLIVFGVLMACLFVLVESKHAKYPVVPLRLFSDRSNIGAFATCFCHALIALSASYWLPLYFQGVIAASSLMSGVYILPYLLATCIMSAASGFIIRLTGNYFYVVSAGMAIATVGFGLFVNLPLNKDFAKIILYQLVAGIGVGPNYQSPLIALQNNVEPHDIGSATSTYGFIRQLASAISIVIGGVVFNNKMQAQQGKLREALGPKLAKMLSGSSASSNVFTVAELQGEQGMIARGAFLTALKTMYIMFAVFAGLGLVASLFIKQRQMSRHHQEHKTGLESMEKSRNGENE
ncbi:MFS domain-containing protein [Fusarium sp. LHS14.1]|nr:MFS domain-containing protein [Fusarium sp. LHS14.1]